MQFTVLIKDSMISNFIGDFQNKNHKYLCMWPEKKSHFFQKQQIWDSGLMPRLTVLQGRRQYILKSAAVESYIHRHMSTD